MAIYFADSSVLVKRYRQEAGSKRTSELLESAERVLIARLTIVEVSAALARRAHATKTEQENLLAALSAFDRDVAGALDIVELDEPLMEYAVKLARQHALRGADAIQLSAALLAGHELSDARITLLSADSELNAAAAAEGLAVVDPTA
ncbi:MAG TPA: type II toxin-antitoxin system VapC family toxin [Phycisphaerae bacterium]|nr:type II toxin-antitoxin system VapC family toxin [Phycisphaerae bacterium]